MLACLYLPVVAWGAESRQVYYEHKFNGWNALIFQNKDKKNFRITTSEIQGNSTLVVQYYQVLQCSTILPAILSDNSSSVYPNAMKQLKGAFQVDDKNIHNITYQVQYADKNIFFIADIEMNHNDFIAYVKNGKHLYFMINDAAPGFKESWYTYSLDGLLEADSVVHYSCVTDSYKNINQRIDRDTAEETLKNRIEQLKKQADTLMN